MPDDFAHWAAIENNRELRIRYKAGKDAVYRWRDESGVNSPPPVFNKPRPVPDTFAQLAATMPRTMLAVHFECGVATVKRWASESGVVLKNGRPAGKRGFNVVSIDTRTDSEASRAQSYLQRFYPVWRCTPEGVFDPKGSHFRCDGITRTQDEMIERAVRKGWNPDAWRLAA